METVWGLLMILGGAAGLIHVLANPEMLKTGGIVDLVISTASLFCGFVLIYHKYSSSMIVGGM